MLNIDIIGGSLSGLSTAISLKKLNSNINVTVYEKHKKIGYNPEGRRCGEAHSVQDEWKKWKPSKKSVFNDIFTVNIIIGNRKYKVSRKPGLYCILNRQEFINQLGKQAKKLGTDIRTDSKIRDIDDLKGDYIIDATGCPSTIKRILGIKQVSLGKTYQQSIEGSNYFDKNSVKLFMLGGNSYIWIFPRDPKKREINCGIGISSLKNFDLKKNLEEFKKKNHIKGKINYTTGGLIPIGLQKPLKYKNILFVGDSGVGTMPITGEGIHRALLSGDIAANCIAKNKANTYPYEITRAFIKWQIIAMNLLRLGNIVNNIGEDATIFICNKVFKRIFNNNY